MNHDTPPRSTRYRDVVVASFGYPDGYPPLSETQQELIRGTFAYAVATTRDHMADLAHDLRKHAIRPSRRRPW